MGFNFLLTAQALNFQFWDFSFSFFFFASPSLCCLLLPFCEYTNGFDYIIATNFISLTSTVTHHKQKSEPQTPLRQRLVCTVERPFMLVQFKKNVSVGKRNLRGVARNKVLTTNQWIPVLLIVKARVNPGAQDQCSPCRACSIQ